MKRTILRTAVGIGAMVTLIPVFAFALDRPLGPRGQHHGPPPEAIEACEGKNAGDSVRFETPRGHIITGTCEERDGLFFAIPEGGPPPRGERDQ
jgi:hypothetical protein